MKNFTISLLLCFIFPTLYAQNGDANIQKIETSISDYFKKERENIHVHFSKDVYFDKEQISFKGYVYNQQNQLLFEQTTNVFVEIFDTTQKLIHRKLLFANNGVFQNNIELENNLPSGKYYFRFYTNYMNNFTEDLSSTYTLNIVNSNQNTGVFENQVDVSKINIAVYPESGIFLSDIQNKLSVKITDCFGNGLEVKKAKVLDNQQKEIMTFYTNKYGYGTFEVLGSNVNNYTIAVEVGGKTFTEIMSKPSYSGVLLSVNNYALSDKTLFTVKSKSIDTSKKYFLVISQNGKSVINPVDFKGKSEWSFLIENAVLYNGVNSARIVDEDLNKYSERLFFLKKTEKPAFSILKNKEKKELNISSTNQQQNIKLLSTSVVPTNSKSVNSGRNIMNSLLINPYTKENSLYDLDYFAEDSKMTNFDIDLFFMHQKSKTDWNNIQLKNLPSSNYTFDNGISLKGTVNQKIDNQKKYSIQLFSLEAQLNEFVALNDKNEFEFKNLILSDSTRVNFRLIDSNRKDVALTTNIRILDNDKPFKKELEVYKSNQCVHQEIVKKVEKETFPIFKNAIALETVEINVKQKSRQEKLSKATKGDNILLKGFKGADLIFFKDVMVIDFLKSKGFNVVRVNGEDKVTSSRGVFSGYKPSKEEQKEASGSSSSMKLEAKSPQITIDDFEQMTHEYLLSLQMNQVDEIYYDRTVTVGSASSAKGYTGMIKIFTKIPDGLTSKNFTIPFQIKKGFSKNYDFKTGIYKSYVGEGFENYGILQWKSNIITDENGNFKLNLPSFNQKSVDVFIEGVSLNGDLFSERKTIILD